MCLGTGGSSIQLPPKVPVAPPSRTTSSRLPTLSMPTPRDQGVIHPRDGTKQERRVKSHHDPTTRVTIAQLAQQMSIITNCLWPYCLAGDKAAKEFEQLKEEESMELSSEVDKNKALVDDARKRMFETELKVFVVEAKLIKAKQVEKLGAEAETRSKTEEKIIQECEDYVMVAFEDLKLKTFKEGWDATLNAVGVTMDSPLYQQHTRTPSPGGG
ncbi:unnamed protein product [Ilex paraguariensis]|uniref:Uncharacterized protein n=1 Tax=Ilex paraguariensis TaxID=185542 RepID=A0ABC8S7J6_9AQUA